MREQIYSLIKGNEIFNIIFVFDFFKMIIFTLISCFYLYKLGLFKREKIGYRKKNKIIIHSIYMGFFLWLMLLSMLISSIKRSIRLINLYKDLKEMVLVETTGIVADKNAYDRGGNAYIIDNTTYYMTLDFGRMERGKEYRYKYLKNSKYIISFEEDK